MISKGFYFSSKIEKDKGDREFKQLGLEKIDSFINKTIAALRLNYGLFTYNNNYKNI